MKKNCWEIKNCGRHIGGLHEKVSGTCPAYSEAKLNGIHGGKNAGRTCWMIAGTLCEGKTQGTYAEKLLNCVQCDFYDHVRKDESPRFKTSGELNSIIRGC